MSENTPELIAAAPDMLAVLKEIALDPRGGDLPTQIQNAVIAAIAKAEGKSSNAK